MTTFGSTHPFIFGNTPSWSAAKSRHAKPICFALLRSLVCLARSSTELNTGRARLARIAIIAITTSNSIRVNAEEVFLFIYMGAFDEAALGWVAPVTVSSHYFYLSSVGAILGS